MHFGEVVHVFKAKWPAYILDLNLAGGDIFSVPRRNYIQVSGFRPSAL